MLPELTPESTMTFAEALRVEVATLQAQYPMLADVLSRANAVLTDGRLFVHPGGDTAEVRSSDGTQVYHVSPGTCDCPQGMHHADQPCKHRFALRLYQRIAKQRDNRETTPAQPSTCGPIERSAEIGALMGALARAQMQMKNPVCDETNPHFHSRYASLAQVRDAVLPALNAEGIAVTQIPTTPESGWASVTTGLWHTTGQYICGTVRVPVPKADPQGYGCAITYARRYGLQALVCVAGDEDDDGEALRQGGQIRGK